MTRNTTITIENEQYIIYMFPMRLSLTGSDIILKHFGSALIDYFATLFQDINVDLNTLLQADLGGNDIKKPLKEYVQNLKEGTTLKLFEYFLDRPDYIKHNGKGIILNDIYQERGPVHIWKLFFHVIKFLYADFLLSGREKPPLESNKKPEVKQDQAKVKIMKASPLSHSI